MGRQTLKLRVICSDITMGKFSKKFEMAFLFYYLAEWPTPKGVPNKDAHNCQSVGRLRENGAAHRTTMMDAH